MKNRIRTLWAEVSAAVLVVLFLLVGALGFALPKPAQARAGAETTSTILLANAEDYRTYAAALNGGADEVTLGGGTYRISESQVILSGEIDLSGGFEKLGTSTHPFTGGFNGANHTVTVPDETDYIFGTVANATVGGIKVSGTAGLIETVAGDSESGEYTYRQVSGVAKIGATYYTTLQQAIDAASAGETVALVNDVTEDIAVAAGQEITLDLNRHTLTNAGGHTITNSGTLTVTGEGTVDNVTHGKAALYNNVSATAVLDGGVFTRSAEAGTTTGNGGNSYYVILNQGTLTVNAGVTVEANGGYSSLIENGWYNAAQNTTNATAQLTISGGTFSGGINTVKNDEYGVATITGGTFTNTTQAVLLNWNELTVTGGVFVGSDTVAAVVTGVWNPDTSVGNTQITGGNFTGSLSEVAGYSNGIDYEISGGTYSEIPNYVYFADGYVHEALSNGTYGVAGGTGEEARSYVAVIGTVGYESLQAAINAAAGKTVRLLGNLSLDSQITIITNNVTLDLGGYTVTSTAYTAFRVNNVNVTVLNGSINATYEAFRAVGGEGEAVNTLTLKEDLNVVSETDCSVFIYGSIKLVTSANLTSKGVYATIQGNGANAGYTDITINGGSVISETGMAIYQPQYNGTLTVNGGEIKGETGIEIRGGKLIINGGTITATATSFSATPNGNGATVTGAAVAVSQHTTNKPTSLTVNGGTLTGIYAVYEADLQDEITTGISFSLTGGTYEGKVDSENKTQFVTGGTYSEALNASYISSSALVNAQEGGGYKVYTDEEAVSELGYVVKIGVTGYESLAHAVAAVPTDNTETTIVFLPATGVVSGAGVKVVAGQNIVIDFNGITYNVTNTVGSAGTETNGFQLLKGSTVTMKNGTLTSSTAYILIQNYCNLTLVDMTLDESENSNISYVVSNNFGSLTVAGDTDIIAAEGKVAFDLYYGMSSSYDDGITVTFGDDFTGTVKGTIEYGKDNRVTTDTWQDKAALTIENGTFDVTFSVYSGEANNANVAISGGTFTKLPNYNYFATGFVHTQTTDSEGNTVYGVTAGSYVASIGAVGYVAFTDAITAAADGATVKLLADITVTDRLSGYNAGIVIDGKSLVLEGQNHKISTDSIQRLFWVIGGATASDTKTVTLKNLTLDNEYTAFSARALETRGGYFVLNLENTVLFTGKSGAHSQALTIGGNHANGQTNTVNIKNSKILGGGSGSEEGNTEYGIVFFNPVEMNITNSTVAGWTALYFKGPDGSEGSAGSVVNVDGGSKLIGTSIYSGSTDEFGVIVYEDDNITVNISDATVESVQGGTAKQSIALFSAGNPVQNNALNIKDGANIIVGSQESGDFADGVVDDNTIAISGGTFSVIPNYTYFANGYVHEDLGNGTYGVKRGTYVAAIGTVGYETLQAAINAAQDGQTVQLTDNVAENVTVAADRNIVLDLGGKTITNAGGHTITNYGTLTITGAGTVDNVTHARGALVNYGTAILRGGVFTRSAEAGTATGNGGNSWYVIDNQGEMQIYDGTTVTSTSGYSSMIRNADVDHAATLTVYGGELSGGLNTIKNGEYGTAVIEGGTFTNSTQAVLLNWNNLTVTGGEFIGSDTVASVMTGYYSEDAVGNTQITGGNFKGALAGFNGYSEDIAYEVSGGTFESAGELLNSYAIPVEWAVYYTTNPAVTTVCALASVPEGAVLVAGWSTSGFDGYTIDPAYIAFVVGGDTIIITAEDFAHRALIELNVEKEILLATYLYSENGKAQLESVVENAAAVMEEFAAVDSFNDIMKAYNTAIRDLDAVLTVNEEADSLADAVADAKADVRLYAAVLGVALPDDIYVGIESAVDVSQVKAAKLAAMDRLDQILADAVAALEAVKAAAIAEIQAAAAETAEGAGDAVVLPTATYAAINNAASLDEVAFYKTNALAEINDVRTYRAQLNALISGDGETLLAAIQALSNALLDTVDGNGDPVLGKLSQLQNAIETEIGNAQSAINTATSDELSDLYNDLTGYLDAALATLKTDLLGAIGGLSGRLDTVDSALTTIKNVVNTNGGKLDQLATELADAKALINTANGKLDALDGRITNEVLTAIAAAKAAAEQVTTDLTGVINTAIGTVNTTIATLTEQISQYNTQLAAVGNNVSQILVDLGGAKSEILNALSDLNGAIADQEDATADNTQAILEKIAAAQEKIDSISETVSATVVVEESKDQAFEDLETWINAYVDSILTPAAGGDTAERGVQTFAAVVMGRTVKAFADVPADLESKIRQAFSATNAELVIKYYKEAIDAINAATTTQEISTAVSTFKTQVATVEVIDSLKPADNTGLYVLLVIIAVAVIVAVVILILLLLKKKNAPAPVAEKVSEEKKTVEPEQASAEPEEEPAAAAVTEEAAAQSEEVPAEETAEEETEETDEEPADEEDEADEEEEGGAEAETAIALSEEEVAELIKRYNFSYAARLVLADPILQVASGTLTDEILAYKGVKVRESWKQKRFNKGRKTVACLLFKGKKLCLALALDPVRFADTKYRVTNVSEVKRFAQTPTLIKLTSARKMKYAKELIALMMEEIGAPRMEGAGPEEDATKYLLRRESPEKLVSRGLARTYEVDASATEFFNKSKD